MRGFIGDIPYTGCPVVHVITAVAEQHHRPSEVLRNSIPEDGHSVIDLPDKTIGLADLDTRYQ